MTSSDGNNHGQGAGQGPVDDFDNDPFAGLTELLERDFARIEPAPKTAAVSIEVAAEGVSSAEGISDDERLDRLLAELSDSPVTQMPGADHSQAGETAGPDLGTLNFEAEFAEALDTELDSDAYRPVVIARTATPTRIEPESAGPVAASAVADASYASWIGPRDAGRKPELHAPKAEAASAVSHSTLPLAANFSGSVDDAFAPGPDSELELALSGLSAPANPRQILFHRSEAFAPDRAETPPKYQPDEKPFDDFDELIASELAAMRPIPTSQPATHSSPHAAVAYETLPDPHQHRETAVSDDAVDWNARGSMRSSPATRVAPVLAAGPAAGTANRGWGLGASVFAIAVIGGLGAYVLTGDDLIGAPGDVLVVRADSSPVKVAPQDPGGRSIPNQNKAVYERVQSAATDVQPSQKTLLTAVEEPVDLPQAEDNGLPGVDLSPITGARAAELASDDASSVPGVSAVVEPDPNVLQPRRVRTLTVRPDGTLVVENAAPSGDPSSSSTEAPAMLATAAKPVEMSPASIPVAKSAPAEPLAVEPIEPQTAESVVPESTTTPIPEPTQTASIEAPEPSPVIAAAPAASSAYYVQISSQPSEDAANQSRSNLTKRYASVIGGRNVVIQTADIKGKGTYYRVRVGVDSRDEANSLCASLKSAGGSCFVSR